MPATLLTPAVAAAATPDYGTGISGINSTLTSIDVDTTSLAATLATIASSLAVIATNSIEAATSLTATSNSLTIGSTSISQIVSSLMLEVKDIKDLAAGSGIHTVGAYEWLGLMSSYKLYVEDDGAIGLEALTAYRDKVNALPTSFN
jgi:hypothetical protein